MLDESGPWRESLLTMAREIERRAAHRVWRERTGYLVERDLVLGAFSVRKLIDSEKCSSLLPDERLSVGIHRLTSREPRSSDRWTFWEHYNMESRRRGSLTVRELCNSIIHSFVLDFAPTSEHGPATLWVVSDRDKRRHLHSIAFTDIVRLFRRVGSEDVVYLHELRRQQPTATSYRLSQHDLVDAGLATYDPYPQVGDWGGDQDALARAFPLLRRPPA